MIGALLVGFIALFGELHGQLATIGQDGQRKAKPCVPALAEGISVEDDSPCIEAVRLALHQSRIRPRNGMRMYEEVDPVGGEHKPRNIPLFDPLKRAVWGWECPHSAGNGRHNAIRGGLPAIYDLIDKPYLGIGNPRRVFLIGFKGDVGSQLAHGRFGSDADGFLCRLGGPPSGDGGPSREPQGTQNKDRAEDAQISLKSYPPHIVFGGKSLPALFAPALLR